MGYEGVEEVLGRVHETPAVVVESVGDAGEVVRTPAPHQVEHVVGVGIGSVLGHVHGHDDLRAEVSLLAPDVIVLAARHEVVQSGVDDPLEGGLGACIVAGEDLGLALVCEGALLGDAADGVLVVLVRLRRQVVGAGSELVDDELPELGPRSVGRLLITDEDLGDERRSAPVLGQHHMGPGAEEPCLGDGALGDGRVGLHVADQEVALENDVVCTAVVAAEGTGLGMRAELVELCPLVVVTTGSTSAVDVVGRQVREELVVVVERVHLGIDGRDGRKGIVVILVELFLAYGALLLDIEEILVAGGEGHRCKHHRYSDK